MPISETIIPFSKPKLTKMLLSSVGCILLGLYFLIFQPQEPGILLTLPILAIILGSLIFFIGLLIGALSFRKILRNGPGLIIDTSGFTDYSSGLAAGHVSWTEVKALKVFTVTKYKTKFIAIILKDPNAYLERQQNALKRKAMLVNLHKYGSPLQLNSTTLQCSFDELLAHLQNYFDSSRPSVLN